MSLTRGQGSLNYAQLLSLLHPTLQMATLARMPQLELSLVSSSDDAGSYLQELMQ